MMKVSFGEKGPRRAFQALSERSFEVSRERRQIDSKEAAMIEPVRDDDLTIIFTVYKMTL
jgi:hypothetical protein